MVKKPSLSIHIELYIIYPFHNNKYWRTFFSFFISEKLSSLILVSLGSNLKKKFPWLFLSPNQSYVKKSGQKGLWMGFYSQCQFQRPLMVGLISHQSCFIVNLSIPSLLTTLKSFNVVISRSLSTFVPVGLPELADWGWSPCFWGWSPCFQTRIFPKPSVNCYEPRLLRPF